MSKIPTPDLDTYIDSARPDFEDHLTRLVEIPTVSADPAYREDILRGARLAATTLEEFGFKASVIETAGFPVVTGQLTLDPSWPTLTIYNHLDVQPAESDTWSSDPFKLAVVGDRYFGRGTTDDKGPALTALFATRFARASHIPLNFKIIWEFEEEIGSPHFSDFVLDSGSNLATDSILISDTIWTAPGRPTIDYGLRGMVTFEVSLQTASKDVHSGLAGGVARNPLGEVSQIISECYDAVTGHVKIPGFYDSVAKPTSAEIRDFAGSGFNLDEFATSHGLTSLRTSDTHAAISKIMAEPTFEVHGIVGGYVGPDIKTVIPPRATAKLSARLVPGQHPIKIFKLIQDFILSSHPDAKVVLGNSLEPYLGQFDGPHAEAARNAVNKTYGVAPSFVREGGSIGAVITMSRVLKVPIMLMGLSLPADGYHAPDESYSWSQAAGGIKLFVNYFTEVSKL